MQKRLKSWHRVQQSPLLPSFWVLCGSPLNWIIGFTRATLNWNSGFYMVYPNHYHGFYMAHPQPQYRVLRQLIQHSSRVLSVWPQPKSGFYTNPFIYTNPSIGFFQLKMKMTSINRGLHWQAVYKCRNTSSKYVLRHLYTACQHCS